MQKYLTKCIIWDIIHADDREMYRDTLNPRQSSHRTSGTEGEEGTKRLNISSCHRLLTYNYL